MAFGAVEAMFHALFSLVIEENQRLSSLSDRFSAGKEPLICNQQKDAWNP
jgi:hypothetical protein